MAEINVIRRATKLEQVRYSTLPSVLLPLDDACEALVASAFMRPWLAAAVRAALLKGDTFELVKDGDPMAVYKLATDEESLGAESTKLGKSRSEEPRYRVSVSQDPVERETVLATIPEAARFLFRQLLTRLPASVMVGESSVTLAGLEKVLPVPGQLKARMKAYLSAGLILKMESGDGGE